MFRQMDGSVLIRNSKRPSEWISDTAESWRVFVAAARDGEFDLPGENFVTRAELHSEIARLSVEVEKLHAALRHPSSRSRSS